MKALHRLHESSRRETGSRPDKANNLDVGDTQQDPANPNASSLQFCSSFLSGGISVPPDLRCFSNGVFLPPSAFTESYDSTDRPPVSIRTTKNGLTSYEVPIFLGYKLFQTMAARRPPKCSTTRITCSDWFTLRDHPNFFSDVKRPGGNERNKEVQQE